MKQRNKIPLLLLLAVPALPGHAQQGVTVIRPPQHDTSDPGIRRVPAANAPVVQPPSAPPSAPSAAPALPVVRDIGNGSVLPAPASGGELSQAFSAAKPLSDAEAAALASALKAVDDGRYGDARASVANVGNPLLGRIVEWYVLRAAPRPDAPFAAIAAFLHDNPDWPESDVLRRQAEDHIGADAAPAEIWRYFLENPPLTSSGYLKRMEAAAAVAPNAVPRLAGESWRNATFKPVDEDEFLNRYGTHLSGADHVARFDRIMREGRPQVARELYAKLPPDYQPVANARLAMATRAADAVTIIRGLSAARLAEPTLRLERVTWLRRTGNLDEAKTLLVTPGADQGDAAWNERQQVARDLLAAGRPADAYAVVIQHGQTRGIAFAEAEFLAGWIALRHLKKPADALGHFQTLFDGVTTDISKSRAAYWLGRSYEALGKAKEANDWYGRAAGYGQTFYGQLAARKLPGGAARLPSDPAIGDADRQALGGRELVAVARYLGQAQAFDRTQPFLLKLARMVNGPGETALLAQLATDLRRPDVGVTIARHAIENGVTLFDASFPVVDLGNTGAIERALALAVTRQESAFYAAAVSPSGALGLMQLLPGTARDVAVKLSLPFIQDKLTRDPAYNVTLGTQYLSDMLQRFGGSYELALAAYNAGPGRVARWLDTIGDPRNGHIDMVDWIEMIPIRETRNYVQRIMEGVGVYRDRLNGPFRTLAPALGRS